MKLFLKIVWILTILLGVATGLFKILQQPEDILLFEKIGINATGTTIIGVIQLIAGLLLIPARTRKWGAYVLIPTFIIASVAIFANELWVFGIVSLLFIVMAVGVIIMENQKTKE